MAASKIKGRSCSPRFAREKQQANSLLTKFYLQKSISFFYSKGIITIREIKILIKTPLLATKGLLLPYGRSESNSPSLAHGILSLISNLSQGYRVCCKARGILFAKLVVIINQGLMAEWSKRGTVNTFYRGSNPLKTLNFHQNLIYTTDLF